MTRQPEPGAIAYVVQEPKFKDREGRPRKVNMLPVLEWGSAELLLEDDAASMLNTAAMVRTLKRKLATYGDKDFIVAAGAPAAIGAACAIAAIANRGRVNVLVWDRQETKYYVVRLNLLEET